MKKLFLLVFIVSVVGAATAEVIDSVSFNPSRLGRYEHLKVSDKLDVGCLTTQSMMLDVGCQVTMNYSGSSAVEIGCAYVSGVDMDDDETTMYVSSVYLIGGTTETNEDVKLTGNLQAPEATSVYASTLNLPNHTVRVNGGGKLWNGIGSSTKQFVLGGNDIPSPQSGDCESLDWFTRKDDITNTNVKVLGCKKKEDPQCKVSIGGISTKTFTNSIPTDTCDGVDNMWYSGGCTESMISKVSCTDYYFIGCSGPTMVGYWNSDTTGGDWVAGYYPPGELSAVGGCTNQSYSNSYRANRILEFLKGKGNNVNPSEACKYIVSEYPDGNPTWMTNNGGGHYSYSEEAYDCHNKGTSNYTAHCSASGSTHLRWCQAVKLTCDLDMNVEREYKYRTITFKME